jgi:tetratricopeptide (TPR) repeat protein
MRRLLIVWLLAAAGMAEDRWIRFESGPFEVFTDAGGRDGREALMHFEQFRHALAQVLGEQELTTPQPVRILLLKKPPAAGPVVRGRDRTAILLAPRGAVPPAVQRECARLLLETNTARMPAAIEQGLAELFSTLEVAGPRITLGRKPENPGRDWARMHMLAVHPDYYGKLRVLLANLRRGVDPGAAHRNAFGKEPAEVERHLDQYLAAGQFDTVPVSGRPMSERDFYEKPVEPAAARLAVADLLLGEPSRAIYEELLRQKAHVPEAHEGLGLLALAGRRPEEARRQFSAAMAASSQSARCYVEYARLETDRAKALAALERASQLNPRLAEPAFLSAQRETDLQKRLAHLKRAVELDARNAGYWQALAEAALAAHNYGEAARAWRGAEQAATDPQLRDRMAQARAAVEEQRLDWEAAERRRVADEKQRELERLKAEARAEVRALESRYNRGGAARAEKVVPWWDGPRAEGRARGNLKQVDCLGRQFRLVIEGDNRKTVKLLITDAAQIALIGGGELTLGCGAQKPRRVSIEYFPKPNAKLGTAGEVATIEFQ